MWQRDAGTWGRKLIGGFSKREVLHLGRGGSCRVVERSQTSEGDRICSFWDGRSSHPGNTTTRHSWPGCLPLGPSSPCLAPCLLSPSRWPSCQCSLRKTGPLYPQAPPISVSTLNHIAWVQVGTGSVQSGTCRGSLALVSVVRGRWQMVCPPWNSQVREPTPVPSIPPEWAFKSSGRKLNNQQGAWGLSSLLLSGAFQEGSCFLSLFLEQDDMSDQI